MCGIFGISYGPEGPAGELWTPTEFAQQMFPAIVHRGPHAFGWMSYNPETGITVAKHKGKVTTKGNLKKIALDDNATWLVGHVRYATNGKPEHMPNNHPLTHGSVVGVHNGVLRRESWEAILAETGREDSTAEVDSEAIFAAVHKWGIRGGLSRIEGDMVAVFARTSHPESLSIARSYGRPLVYATTAAGSLIFASECCVIDACGLGFKATDYTHMSGQYRLLRVSGGKVRERSQYRAAKPANAHKALSTYVPARRSTPIPLPFEQGGVSGITDYFDRQRNLSRPSVGPSSLDDPGSPAHGTRAGTKDRHGGEYLGAGWYRAPNGQVMPVDRYVEWCIEQDRARRDIEIDMDTAAEAAAADEAAAQAIINNNEEVR
jgi:predicted glutamine amidotransferase